MQDLSLLLGFTLSPRALVLHSCGAIASTGFVEGSGDSPISHHGKTLGMSTRFVGKCSQPPLLSVVSCDFHTNTPTEGKKPTQTIKQEIQPSPHAPAQPSPPSVSWISLLCTWGAWHRFPGALTDIYTISLLCCITKRCVSGDGAII